MPTEIHGDGDQWLRSPERRIWSLVHHILLTWHTLVIFRHTPARVRDNEREVIEFFVPRQSPHWHVIHEYLEQELADLSEPESENWPGTAVHVVVRLYSGLSPYLDRPTVRGITERALAMFRDRLERET